MFEALKDADATARAIKKANLKYTNIKGDAAPFIVILSKPPNQRRRSHMLHPYYDAIKSNSETLASHENIVNPGAFQAKA